MGNLVSGLLLWPFAYFGLRDTRLARSAAILLPALILVAVVGSLLAGALVIPILVLAAISGIAVCSTIGWTRKVRNVGRSSN